MLLYRCFLFVLSLFNPKSWGKEKVWVSPALLGHGQSQYLRVGSQVFDSKGRLCVVVKQGKNGALKRLSHAKTEDTVAGWSFKKRLGWVYFKYMQSRHFVLKRALLLGPSLKFKWMMQVLKARVLIYRFKKACRSWHTIFGPTTLDNAVLWWFIVAPLVVGTLLSLGGVL